MPLYIAYRPRHISLKLRRLSTEATELLGGHAPIAHRPGTYFIATFTA